MADRYVYSGGSNTSPYNSWATAATSAFTVSPAAGDRIFVASDHTENTAGTTLALGGSTASPTQWFSVSRLGSVPPTHADLVAGATILVTGSLSVSGFARAQGFVFGTSGTTSSVTLGSVAGRTQFRDCVFQCGNTLTLITTTVAHELIIDNCQWKNIGSTSARLVFGGRGGRSVWTNNGTSLLDPSSSSFPTTLFTSIGQGARATFVGIDLSQFSNLGTIGNTAPTVVQFINCRLHASLALTVATATIGPEVEFIGCGSASTAVNERHQYEGVLTTDTVVKRTAGASDGVAGYSWKMVSSANSKDYAALRSFEGVIWNDVVGSLRTLTVHMVTNNVTLSDADMTLEVEYLSSASYPVSGATSSGRASPLATAVNYPTTTEAWTTTGIATPRKMTMSATFTPQMAGPIRWRARLVRASTTVYVDPKADLS